MTKVQLQNKSEDHSEWMFWMHECRWPRHWNTSPFVYNLCIHGAQPGRLIGPTQASLLVEVLMLFRRVIHWLPRLIFKSLPASEASVQWGGRSVVRRKTTPKQLDLLIFSAFSEEWIPQLSILRLTSKLMRRISYSFLPTLRTQRCSNTESVHTFYTLSGQQQWKGNKEFGRIT